MSSRDSSGDGGIEFGAPGIGGQAAIGEPQSSQPSAEAGASGGLTLDEAENIAARRLRELAIRLGDDDNERVSDEPGLVTFDADRHLRTRLAQRIASIGSSEGEEQADSAQSREDGIRPLAETGVCGRYVVTDALPLSAFGNALAALSLGRPDLPAPAIAKNEMPTDGLAAHDLMSAELLAPAEQDERGDAVDAPLPQADAMPESAMRLVDLIKEQRLLLDRLGRLGRIPLAGAMALSSVDRDAKPVSTVPQTPRSDAEELFEAATYAPEAAGSDNTVEEGPDPVAMSAEQLIAALKETRPDEEQEPESVVELPEPVVEFKPSPPIERLGPSLLQELVDRNPDAARRPQSVMRQPSSMSALGTTGMELAPRALSLGLAVEERRLLPVTLASDPAPERPPIIIERARAEMAALANGTVPPHASHTSAAIGFLTGLTLSLVCGVVLFFML
jgi:hypothetical protein